MAEQKASASGRGDVSGTTVPEEAGSTRRLAILLAMAMFVLVVDTSVMNVSISAVVHDLHTTVSSVQSAIALEALVSAAFILIGSKVGDLFGRKRAYVLGLLGYAIGALAMMLSLGLPIATARICTLSVRRGSWASEADSRGPPPRRRLLDAARSRSCRRLPCVLDAAVARSAASKQY